MILSVCFDSFFSYELYLFWQNYICTTANQRSNQHVRQRVSNREIHLHEQTIERKTDRPDDQIPQTYGFRRIIPVQEEIIRDLDGNHGRENGADQIQEICDVVHREDDGADSADDGDGDSDPLTGGLRDNGLARDACGIRVEKRRRITRGSLLAAASASPS